MRIRGRLTKWNDERGFGFVELSPRSEEIFVHISAFPKDGVRPRVGELISFDVRQRPDGKKRAEKVARRRARRSESKPLARPNRSSVGSLLAIIAIGALVVFGYGVYTSDHGSSAELSISTPFTSIPERAAVDPSFSCDGRTHCSQMTSCAEATYFLQHCPNIKMDGDFDGKPCERQLCID